MKKADAVTFPDGTVQKTAATTTPNPIPSGTKTNFFQATAPVGWTKITTYDNYAMRLVSGSGGGSGGSVNFTSAFASQTPSGSVSIDTSSLSIGATTLSIAQMPSHTHSITTNNYDGSAITGISAAAFSSATTNATGGGGSHTHAISGSATGTFSGSAINLAVKYIDMILASKD